MHFLLTFSSFFFLFYFIFFFRSNSLSEVLKYTRCLEIHTFSRSKGRFHPEILTKALSCHDMYILIEINLSCNNVSLDSQTIPQKTVAREFVFYGLFYSGSGQLRKKNDNSVNETFSCETDHGRQLHVMLSSVGVASCPMKYWNYEYVTFKSM